MPVIHRRPARHNEVALEVEVVDGEVLANVRPLIGEQPSFHWRRLPLNQAAVIATRLSQRFNVDIAVIDLDEVRSSTRRKRPSCVVAMEACAGAHHWGRAIGDLGHEVRLIPPAYVKMW